jgi:hypothetical protein
VKPFDADGAFRPRTEANDLEISPSERRMARLSRCQVRPTEQLCSMQHWPAPDEHSVSEIGPSSASRIAAALMSSGARAS